MSSWKITGHGPLSYLSGQYSSVELQSMLIAELGIQGPENLDDYLTGLGDDGRVLYSGGQLLEALGAEISE